MEVRVDNKHSIYTTADGVPVLAKRLADGKLQPIPSGEPVILFRGRDRLALPMLEFYRKLCQIDGVTDYQLESLDGMIAEFAEFASTSQTMKQPGITKGM